MSHEVSACQQVFLIQPKLANFASLVLSHQDRLYQVKRGMRDIPKWASTSTMFAWLERRLLEIYKHINFSHVIIGQECICQWAHNSALWRFCFSDRCWIWYLCVFRPAGCEGSRCNLYRCLGKYGSERRSRQTTRNLQKLPGMQYCTV